MDVGKRPFIGTFFFSGRMAIGIILIFLLVTDMATAWAQAVVKVTVQADRIQVSAADPTVTYLHLRIANPSGEVIVNSESDTGSLVWTISQGASDGLYIYAISVHFGPRNRTRGADAQDSTERIRPWRQSGAFTVKNGAILDPSLEEVGRLRKIRGGISALGALVIDFLVPAAHADQVIGDDLIVTGSECVGADCVNGEFFGYVGGDTLRLKDKNLRIHFDDTSDNTFPSNDWRILINDITSGGASYFAVEDSTAGRISFKIEAGAPADALTISRSGRIGFGTAIPQKELHILDGDTPTMRFEQDGSAGWAPQTWDVAGNETNFFIRDVSNASLLPFRIQPGAPNSALCLKSDGVGFGTWAPAAPMELETRAKDAEFLLDRTDGASGLLSATAAAVVLGSKSDHPLNLVVNSTAAMTIDTVGRVGIGTATPTESLHVVGNALVSGNLEVGSSRALKQNIEPIEATAAMAVLAALRPVKFNYKIDPEEESLGFIAEEVPDMVATSSRKSLSPMDLVAVLAKVAQEQQQTIETLSRRVADLEKELERTSPVVSADLAQLTGSGI